MFFLLRNEMLDGITRASQDELFDYSTIELYKLLISLRYARESSRI